MDDILKDGFVGRASRCPTGNTCVGENDIELAESPGKIPEEPLAVRCHCNVSAIAVCARAEFGDRLIQRLLVAAGDGDFGAFCDEETGSGKTDAAVTSSNEGLFTCEFHDFSLMGGHY